MGSIDIPHPHTIYSALWSYAKLERRPGKIRNFKDFSRVLEFGVVNTVK